MVGGVEEGVMEGVSRRVEGVVDGGERVKFLQKTV